METISQKEYFERILEERDKALSAALASTKEAIIKADTANDKRFEGVNEFRNQLKDQQLTFLTRNEYDRAHTDLVHTVESNSKTLSEQIAILTSRIDRKDGEKVGGTDVRGWIFAGISAIIAIISIAYSILK